MPDIAPNQHHRMVRQILDHTHNFLHMAEDAEAPPLAVLLARAADLLRIEDHHSLAEPAIAQAVAEAARHLTALAGTPRMPTDPNLQHHLQALDRLPRAARVGLLAAAVQRTASRRVGAQAPTTRDPAPGWQPPARRRTTGPCPCACSTGAFCGGCGHAGCGSRR